MKKVFVFVLCLIMALSSFACTAKTPAATEETAAAPAATAAEEATTEPAATTESKPLKVGIYGTDGILLMGDPNQFGAPVHLQKTNAAPVEFPLTHGFRENSRGLGAAEMAWSIRAGRKHRASKEMAFHVFETMHGIMTSAQSGNAQAITSRFETPEALPEGYIGDGGWTRKEESALI